MTGVPQEVPDAIDRALRPYVPAVADRQAANMAVMVALSLVGATFRPLPPQRVTVYVSVGNSDDKLPQTAWAMLCTQLRALFTPGPTVRGGLPRIHAECYSAPAARWQNACMCAEIDPADLDMLRDALAALAGQFGQDAIALAVVPEVEMIRPPKPQIRAVP